jgi:hypothetical protein
MQQPVIQLGTAIHGKVFSGGALNRFQKPLLVQKSPLRPGPNHLQELVRARGYEPGRAPPAVQEFGKEFFAWKRWEKSANLLGSILTNGPALLWREPGLMAGVRTLRPDRCLS